MALTILAVASAGLLRAAEGHVDRIRQIERRAAAAWLAEGVLADLRLGRLSIEAASGPQVMAGLPFQVSVFARPTDDPQLLRADISVSETTEGGALFQLTGFLDAGAQP